MLSCRLFMSCILAGSLILPSQGLAFDCPAPGVEKFLGSDRISEFSVVSGDLHVASQYRIPQTRFGRFIWYNFRRERVRLQTWQGRITGQILQPNGPPQPFDNVVSFNLICDDRGTCDHDLEVRRNYASGQIMFLQASKNGGYEVNISYCDAPTYDTSTESLTRIQQCMNVGGC